MECLQFLPSIVRTWSVRAVSTGVVVLQTPEPEVGPDELVEYWPVVVRAAWFFAGFLLVALLGWAVVVPLVARVIRRRNPNNPTLHEAITRYARVVVLVVAVVVGAGTAGYGQILGNSALVIAAVSLALGVAGQEVIGSLVSGVALVVDPEFNVGDYIQWTDGEGTVQSITLRVTRVVTPNGELVTIPNTVLTSDVIVRPYGRGRYRVVDRVDVSYDDDVGEVRRVLTETAAGLDRVVDAPSPGAHVDEFGDDAVVFRVHYWIDDPNRREIFDVRSAYADAVLDRLEGADLRVSPPSEHALEGELGIDQENDVEEETGGPG